MKMKENDETGMKRRDMEKKCENITQKRKLCSFYQRSWPRVFTEYSLLDSRGPGYWDLGYRGYKEAFYRGPGRAGPGRKLEAGSRKPEAGTKMNKRNKNKIIMKVMSLILFKLTLPQLTVP